MRIVFDGFGLIIIGIIVVGTILFYLIKGICNIWDRIFHYNAYVKVFTDAPQMLLDRKWGIKYKKHFWNKWKIYEDTERKYTDDYLEYEADNIAHKIRIGEIKI